MTSVREYDNFVIQRCIEKRMKRLSGGQLILKTPLRKRFGLSFQPDFFGSNEAVSLLNAKANPISLPIDNFNFGGKPSGSGASGDPELVEQLSQARSRIQMLEQVERPVMIEREADALNEASLQETARGITEASANQALQRVYNEIYADRGGGLTPGQFRQSPVLERVRVTSDLLGGTDVLNRRLFQGEGWI